MDINKDNPALVEVTLMYKGQITYCENLSFMTEPVDEDIIAFVKLIRPTTKHDFIICKYIRPLKETEK